MGTQIVYLGMSYNQEYSPGGDLDINRSISVLHEIQEDALQLLIEFLLNCNQVNQKCTELVPLLQLSIKIRLNLEAIQVLLPQLTRDFRLKTPVNLLYRGIISDVVNILYLLSWYRPGYTEQPFLVTELDILRSDFLTAMDHMIAAEDELVPSEKENNARWREDFIHHNIRLYDRETSKWLKPIQIRRKTAAEYNGNFNLNGSTETFRIGHVGAVGLVNNSLLMKSFKYLSQYQHYSPTMHEIVMQDPRYELQIYEDVLYCLLITMEHLSEVLNYNSREDYILKRDAMARKFKDAYRNKEESR